MANEQDTPIMVAPEPKRWQVRFASGQGLQMAAASEAQVRAAVLKEFGPDYAETVTELFEIKPA